MKDDAYHRNRRVLVLVEREGPSIAPITFELLGIGKKIVFEINGTLCAAVLGQHINDLSERIALFADEIYSLDHPLADEFRPDLYATALEQLCRETNPQVVLIGCTLNNLDLAPRVAHRMGVQLITDCINLSIESGSGHLLCAKPVFGGKVIATFKLEKKPYIVTFRPKVIDPIESGSKRGKIIPFTPVINGSSANVTLIKNIQQDRNQINKAEAIVSGGRGIKDEGGLEKLKGLVRVLRKYFDIVELGASRPLVDAHLVPSSRQIGLTGEKAAPKVYIAIGISGSLQHMTGVLGAKKIVAINNSPKAYIFQVADYGVIGDFEEVVPALCKKLEEL